MNEQKKWFELTTGAVIDEPGNAIEYKTGSWRTFKPVIDKSKCNDCLICWIYCLIIR